MNKSVDVCVIGGGASGISAALGAIENGAKKVMLIERDLILGGILNQCIHNGFGLHTFNEELTGPTYASRLITKLKEYDVEIKLNTTVIKITEDKQVHYINGVDGYNVIDCSAVVVSVGCREKTSHQIELEGKRLAGIMTAGVAQHYLNIDGYLVGKKVFILGSGDIGLIMARRMTLEGAKVLGVAEIMPYSNGLNRNIVQCLHDYNIPLYLSHTVTKVSGNNRLEKITICEVDESFNVKAGTEKDFEVDTLLLSVGLIPENHLLKEIGCQLNPMTNGAIVDETFQTSIPGIYSCGNSLHVHDLVDYASEEGYQAGMNAAKERQRNHFFDVYAGNFIRYCVPNKICNSESDDVTIKFRVTKPIEKGTLTILIDQEIVKEIKKTRLVPSEMESIKIKKSLIKGHVTISIRECGENND